MCIRDRRVSTSTAFGAAIIESRATNGASPSLSTTTTANGAATIPSAAVTYAAHTLTKAHLKSLK
eukprot:1440207-Prymnesium_polylepis.1